MSDQLREQVRARYAAAATAVTAGTPAAEIEAATADTAATEAGCCGPLGSTAAVGSATAVGPTAGVGSAPAAGSTAEVGSAPAAGSSAAVDTAVTEAGCCGPAVVAGDGFGAALYDLDETEGLPPQAVLASLGCGNPLAVAELRRGETVLDLGSGGGIDVLLSARRVGSTGKAYGLDMTDEMLELARRNAAEADVDNVEFVKGHIEDIPLPDASVDVIISNCVINLSVDKPAVMAEMHRVLAAGGRLGISDVVADDRLTPAERAERGAYVDCIAGALSRSEYRDGLVEVGFTAVEVEFTHEVADGLHGAIVRAVKRA